MSLFFQKYVFAFTLYLSTHLPCCLFYFKISLNSLQKHIFWVKPKQTPTQIQMCSDCNTSVYWESRLLIEPNWATLAAKREFLLDRKILYLSPSSLDGTIFVPSRFGSQLQQQIHTCSCFRVPATKASLGAHSDQRPQPFFPSALWRHTLTDTGLSLFLRLSVFWIFSPYGVLES